MSAFWVTTAWLANVVAMNELGSAYRTLGNPWMVVASLVLAGTILAVTVLWPLRVLGGEQGGLTEAVSGLVGKPVARVACGVVLVTWALIEMRHTASVAGVLLGKPFATGYNISAFAICSLVFALLCCATAPRGGGMWGSARLLGMFSLMLAIGTLMRFGPAIDTRDTWEVVVMPEMAVEDLARVAMPFLLFSSGLWPNGSPLRVAPCLIVFPLLAMMVVNGAVATGEVHMKFPSYAALFAKGSTDWSVAKGVVAVTTAIFPIRWIFHAVRTNFPELPGWLLAGALPCAALLLPGELYWRDALQWNGLYGDVVRGMVLLLFAAAVGKKIYYFVRTPNISPP